MRRDGIAIIGRLAAGAELLDGQTVKTKVLYEELRRSFPEREIRCVDVYRYKRRFIPILWQTLRAFFSCEHIFVLLSRNGRTFFFPILTALNRIFRRKLYHDVIGGALPEEAKRRPALQKQLKRFTLNWVELPSMKDSLAELGIGNVEVLPNFKRLSILSADALQMPKDEPFVFATFSRVTRDKGIGEAIVAVADVNRKKGRKAAVLRVYGQVEEDYRETFDALLHRHEDCVVYCGSVPQDQSVEVLRDCYMLLFPSVYAGEGLPGTIIDAYSAGLPVIASDWHFNAELVHDGVTGWCYDHRDASLLTERLLCAVEHPDEVNAMRSACLAEAAVYTPEHAMQQIAKQLRSGDEASDAARPNHK